ncbi:MAG: LamG domain-containing protein, partial [Candidatus Thermoplasmatota archaeon]|nr:LamG domain-containing protein [Candidatus Thermoplasmatota archaeon]
MRVIILLAVFGLLISGFGSIGLTDAGSVSAPPFFSDGRGNRWTDEFNNGSYIATMAKGDHALNGPEFELANGTIFPGLVRGLNIVDPNTIALWHFDEGSGTKVNDSSSNSKHGTMYNMNSADWVNGIDGSALDFDGTNDYVKVPWSSVLNPSRITVEAWIYPHTLPGQFDSKGFIVHKRVGYYMMIGQFTIETPSVKHANAQSLVKKNQWQYLVGTYDGSNVRLYLDGKNIATTASSTGMTHYNNPLFIGCFDGGSYLSYPYDGLIDEVKLSDKALSATQIRANYHSYYAWKNGYRNTDVFLISNAITVPQNHYWKDLNISKVCPPGSGITVSILDAKNNRYIPGFVNMSGSNLKISGIDPIEYPSIRLRANFTSMDAAYPELDSWSVSWRENISPGIDHVAVPEIVVRTEASHLTIAVSDPDQFEGDLKVSVLSSSRKHPEWDKYAIGGIMYDDKNGTFNVSFSPEENFDLGPYSFRIRVTDHLGASMVLDMMNATLVYSERKLNLTLMQMGTDVTRNIYTNLTLEPNLDGPLEEVNLTIDILFNGTEVDWFTEPALVQGRWEFRIRPPIEADLGWYDISLQVESINFFPFTLFLENSFEILNRLPAIGEIPTIKLQEDDEPGSLIDLTDLIDDVESPRGQLELLLVGQSDPENLTVELIGSELFMVFLKENWYGDSTVSLSLGDDHDTVYRDIQLEVISVQDIPVIEPVPDLQVIEDTYLEYRFNGYDSDPEDRISFLLDLGDLRALIERPEDFMFDPYTGNLSLLVTNDMVGVHELNISIYDGKDWNWSVFKLDVINVNDPPVWERIGTTTVGSNEIVIELDQDSVKELELEGSDMDNEPEDLSFQILDGPGFGSIEGSILRLAPGPYDVGISIFVLNLSDGDCGVSLNLTVKVKNLPDHPVAVAEPVQGPVSDDEIIVLNGSGSSDPDPDEEL